MWDDYAKSIGTTRDKLTQQQKIQAEVNGILEETKFQTGDAAKVAGTYSGQTASLAYNFQALKVAIGQGFMPLAQAILPGINAIVVGLTNLANVFAQVMQLLFGKVSTDGSKAADATQAVADATANAGTEAKKTAKEMKGVLASFDELNILGSQSSSGSDSAAASVPEVPQLTAGGGELFGDVEVNPEIEAFVNRLKDAIANLRDALQPTIDALGRLWEQLQKLGGFAWEGLKDFYETFLKPVGAWVLGEGLPRFIDALTNGLTAVDWEKLLDSLHRFWAALEPFAENVGEGLLWLWENVFVPFGTWALNEAVPAFLDLLSSGLNLLNAVIDKLKPGAQWLWDNFLEPLASWTGDTIISALEELSDLLQDIADTLNGDMSLGEFTSQLTPLQSILLGVGAGAAAAAAGLGLLAVGGMVSSAASTISSLARELSLATIGFRSFHDMVTTVFGPASIIAGIAAVVGGIVLAFTNFFSMMTNGFSWVNEALMLLGIALAAIGAVILGAPATVAAVVAGIVAAVATVAVLVKEHWEEIKAAFLEAWDRIKEVWDTVSTWFDENVIQPVKQFFTDLWENIKNVWSEVTGWFDQNIIQPLTSFFENVTETISSVFEGCWIIIQAVWKAVSDWFKEHIIDPLTQKFTEVTTAIGNFFSDAWAKIKEVWDKVTGWFSTNIVEPVRNKFTEVTAKVKEAFSSAWDKIKEVWKAAGDWFDEHVATPIKNAFQAIKDFVKGIFNGLIGFVEDMINGVIRAINNFLAGFDGLVSKAAAFIGQKWDGTVKLKEVKLPRLANGAVIPPNHQFAAILGDQTRGTNIEAPLETIKQALLEALSTAGGTQQPITVQVTCTLDGKVVARNTIRHVNDITRASGRSPLLV